MHCAKCGNKISKEWKYCKHCGGHLTHQNFTEKSIESSFSLQPILFGLLTIIGTIIGIALLGIWIDFQIHTLSFWVIIPIGGFIVGAMGAFGYFYGLIRSNQKIKLSHYFIGSILGLLTYIGIFYFLYSITYLDENNDVNYSFEGDHISNFVTTDSEEPITFLSYIKLTVFTESEHIIKTRYSASTTYTASAGQNMLEFYLQFLASIVGGGAVGLLLISDKKYCDRCKLYNKSKILFIMNISTFQKNAELIDQSMQSSKHLKELIHNHHKDKISEEAYFEFKLFHCPNCYEGSILFTPYVNKNGEYKSVDDKKINITLNPEFIKDIL